MVLMVSTAVALSVGLTGCPNAASTCASGSLGAVAADGQTSGVNYVVLMSGVGTEYGVVQAANLAPVWHSIDDGTPVAMLAPASGGVVVVNGGAAARRLDASGTLLWTVGYGNLFGVRAALTDGTPAVSDDLVVADTQSVRRYGSDGTPRWEQMLPETTVGVSLVVADRAGGVWLMGTFAGSFSPWVVADGKPADQPSGPFLIHLDPDGVEIGGGAWNAPSLTFGQAAEGVDATGVPMLVIWGATGNAAAPEFGVPKAVGNALFAAGLGSAGQILWSRPLVASTTLQADAGGTVLALTNAAGILSIDRWDSGGAVVGSASYTVDDSKGDGLSWVGAPLPGGLVVAGEQRVLGGQTGYASCVGAHFLLQVTTANLAVTPLPSRLP